MGNAKFLLSFLALLSQVARSEIIPIYLVLDADSTEVHFVRGWLEAPAHIDLSSLVFQGAEEPEFIHGDDGDDYGDDDEFDEFDDDHDEFGDDDQGDDNQGDNNQGDNDQGDNDKGDDVKETSAPTPFEEATPAPVESKVSPAPTEEPSSSPYPSFTPTPAPSPEEGGTEPAPENGKVSPAPSPVPTEMPSESDRFLEGDSGIPQRIKQVMDIVLFILPEDCHTNAFGFCDWASLGIGARDRDVEGEVSYCCAKDTAARGVCSSDDVGKLIVDHSIFKGEHRTMDVPTSPDQDFSLADPLFEVSESGEYVLILGNCDDMGLEVLAIGSMEWKSVGGYLPGEMFGLMFFYAALTAFYVLLVVWYGCGMKIFQEAAIPIQKYIIATMILGVFELFFGALDLGAWNLQGLRSDFLSSAAIIFGVLKRGVSRCLCVMVAMGWGVVRESLGFELFKIILLGAVYSGLSLFRDFLVIYAMEVETLSVNAEEELMDFALLLTPLILFVNLIFCVWIIRSLNATTDYLRNMNQTSKLQRHLRLRCLFITSVTIAVVLLVFSILEDFVGILSQDLIWVMEGAMHVNYLFLLTGVAILWRPNSNAKDYAMQLELPGLGDDDENELELSCVVPSASDVDDGEGNFRASEGNFT